MFAILFDLDGTLTDSNPIHFLAWQKLLEVEKFVIDREFYEKNISGRGNIFRDCTWILFRCYYRIYRKMNECK